ncbi:hypothetical protein BJ742DRAFT_838147 [Cladochytrium replicatum]|nr:hypothetical protein BJ742DRAFT_838147 [Cladochytrium replicatum]
MLNDTNDDVAAAFLAELQRSFASNDGYAVGNLLSVANQRSEEFAFALTEYSDEEIEKWTSSFVAEPYDKFAKQYMMFLASPNTKKLEQFSSAFSLFTAVFKDEWQTLIVQTLCRQLYTVVAEQKQMGTTVEVGNIHVMIQTLLKSIIDDRGESKGDKRGAFLAVANTYFKICEKVNKMHMCKNILDQIIRQMEIPTSLAGRKIVDQLVRQFERLGLPIGQRVAFHYHVGKMEMLYQRFQTADAHLTFSFERCIRDLPHKRLILRNLVIVRMHLGRLPSRRLLEKYEIQPVLGELARCVRQPHFSGYEAALSRDRTLLFRWGCYSLLKDRFSLLMYRNLVFKVASLAETTQVPLDFVVTAAHFSGAIDATMTTVEGMAVALIDEGLIKGYLLHGRQLL